MPCSIFDIKRDPSSGAPLPYRLRHRSPAYSEAIAGVRFVDGVTPDPVPPHAILRIVATLGADLDLLPVDEAAEAARKPAPAPKQATQQPTPAPAPRAPAPAMDLPKNIKALRAIAEARGIEVGNGWNKARIREAIEAHAC